MAAPLRLSIQGVVLVIKEGNTPMNIQNIASFEIGGHFRGHFWDSSRTKYDFTTVRCDLPGSDSVTERIHGNLMKIKEFIVKTMGENFEDQF